MATDTSAGTAQILDAWRAQGIRFVRFELPDMHGTSRAKMVPIERAYDYAENGLNMYGGVGVVDTRSDVVGGTLYHEELGYGDPEVRGHSIEFRINAEDPGKGFLPAPGRVINFYAPEGDGVRFDTMLYEGYVVPPFYDSLLGKLIVAGDTRGEALHRLRTALQTLSIEGLATTRGLHLALLDDEDVRNGAVHTRWLEDWLPSNLPAISRAA